MKKKKEKELTPEFIMIPYPVFSDPELSPMDKFVYGAIYMFFSMPGRECFASNDTLAALAKTRASVVSNCLVRLEERRYITRVFFDEGKRRRKEIIPLVYISTHLPKNVFKARKSDTSGDVSNTSNEISQVMYQKEDSDTSGDVSNTSGGVSEKKSPKTPKKALNKPQNVENSENSDTSGDEERRSIIENQIDSSTGPSDHAESVGETSGEFTKLVKATMRFENAEQIPEKEVSEAIGYFLPVYPSQFASGTPFAIPANRTAVKKVLIRLTLPELKELIRKYDSRKDDKFRPEANTIAYFCAKIDRIEAYVKKSAGGLWAQRSISTPEQAKVREVQYSSKLERSLEEDRKIREQWRKDHPEHK